LGINSGQKREFPPVFPGLSGGTHLVLSGHLADEKIGKIIAAYI
jgi:hypothetical protein